MDTLDTDRVRFGPGEGGLTRAVLRTRSSEAHVYLHGAHVTHFGVDGEPPVLFLSAQSQFTEAKAIRGGVPICFPWFGTRNPDPVGGSPMHGFARVLPWSVLDASADADSTALTLGLTDNDATRRWWPHRFTARYAVGLLADRLSLSLSVENLDAAPFTFEEALHTYFAVSDVRNVLVEGLEGGAYLDKTDNLARKAQSGAVTISGETDRVYLGTRSTCVILDPGHGRAIVNGKDNSDATVVWNPWSAKAKAMADFGDDEWRRMICVETCNVNAHAVELAPGRSHSMGVTIGARAS